MMVLVSYLFGIVIFVRFLRWQAGRIRRGGRYEWDRREILFLIPLGQLMSSSMSSGGVHLGLYGPIGVMMVVLAIASPLRVNLQWRACLSAVTLLLLGSAVHYKAMSPYSWHSYREPPLFTGRQVYRHPVYGPMVIDTDLLHLVTPVCDQVGWSGEHRELLALPFPFANYFCSIAPWHGYVQTFFDTSSKETIQTLMEELEKSPPKWVLYQRQLDNLTMHENVFNHGQPLPHRYLDQMIEHKIEDGEWRMVYRSSYEDRPGWSNEWALIEAR